MRAHRVILWAALWLLVALTIAGASALAFVNVRPDVLLGFMAVGVPLLLMVPAALMIARHRSRVASWMAIGLLALSVPAWMIGMWGVSAWQVQDVFFRVGWAAFACGVYALHIGILSLLPLRDSIASIVRALAWVFAGMPLAALIMIVVGFDWWMGDFMGRVLGALIVCAFACTFATPLLWRLHARRGEDLGEHTLGVHVPVGVVCPRCLVRSDVMANTDARCSGCGLGLRVTVQEPRCACGYLLYGLTGDTCPECGEPIPEAQAWRSDAPAPATPVSSRP